MPRIRKRYIRDKPTAAGAFGPRLGAYFGVPSVPYLALPTEAPRFAVTRLTGGPSLAGRVCKVPPQPVYLVTLYLIPGWLEVRRSGEETVRFGYNVGSIGIDWLGAELVVMPGGPLDCLSFYIRHNFLAEQASNLSMPRGGVLECTHGTPDPILNDIGMALLPLLEAPDQVTLTFLEHMARATCLHLVHTYGGSPRVDYRDTIRQ